MTVSLTAVIDLEQTASALAELAGENELLHVKAHTDKLDRAREPRRARGRAVARDLPPPPQRLARRTRSAC